MRHFVNTAGANDPQLLVPLTAQHPGPVMRLALFKLIGTLISLLPSRDKILALRHVSEPIQLEHSILINYQKLLEPENPFDTVRIESMSILREETASNNVCTCVFQVEISFTNTVTYRTFCHPSFLLNLPPSYFPQRLSVTPIHHSISLPLIFYLHQIRHGGQKWLITFGSYPPVTIPIGQA